VLSQSAGYFRTTPGEIPGARFTAEDALSAVARVRSAANGSYSALLAWQGFHAVRRVAGVGAGLHGSGVAHRLPHDVAVACDVQAA
jgi:hypothetical protein